MSDLSTRVLIDPPKIDPFIEDKERDRTILIPDFRVDKLNGYTIHLDFNIIFSSIPVYIGVIQTAQYNIATNGCSIEVLFDNGTPTNFTQSTDLNVDYSLGKEKTRETNCEISGTGKKGDLSISPKLSYKAGSKRGFKSSFTDKESQLVPKSYHNKISWDWVLHKAEYAFRNYKIGNLYLFTDFIWQTQTERKQGKITVRPKNIMYFNKEDQPISSSRSLLLFFWMTVIRKTPINKLGFEINVEVK